MFASGLSPVSPPSVLCSKWRIWLKVIILIAYWLRKSSDSSGLNLICIGKAVQIVCIRADSHQQWCERCQWNIASLPRALHELQERNIFLNWMQKTEPVHCASLPVKHLSFLLVHTVFNPSVMSLTLLRLPFDAVVSERVLLGLKAWNMRIKTIYIQYGEILNT